MLVVPSVEWPEERFGLLGVKEVVREDTDGIISGGGPGPPMRMDRHFCKEYEDGD